MKNKTLIIIFGFILLISLINIVNAVTYTDTGQLFQNVDACGTLSTSNAVYNLTATYSTRSSSCFTFTGDNQTFRGNNGLVKYATLGTGYGIYISGARKNINISNLSIICGSTGYDTIIFDGDVINISLNSINATCLNAGINGIRSTRGFLNTYVTNSRFNTASSSVYNVVSGAAAYSEITFINDIFNTTASNREFYMSIPHNISFINTSVSYPVLDYAMSSPTEVTYFANNYGSIKFPLLTYGADLSLYDHPLFNASSDSRIKIENNKITNQYIIGGSAEFDYPVDVSLNLNKSFINPYILFNGTTVCNSTSTPTCINYTPLNSGVVNFSVSNLAGGYVSIQGDEIVVNQRYNNCQNITSNMPTFFLYIGTIFAVLALVVIIIVAISIKQSVNGEVSILEDLFNIVPMKVVLISVAIIALTVFIIIIIGASLSGLC